MTQLIGSCRTIQGNQARNFKSTSRYALGQFAINSSDSFKSQKRLRKRKEIKSLRSIEFKNRFQMISSHLLHFLDIHISLDNGVIWPWNSVEPFYLEYCLWVLTNLRKKVKLQSHFPLKRTLKLSTSPFVVDSSNNLWMMKHWVESLLEYACRASIRHGNTYLIFFCPRFYLTIFILPWSPETIHRKPDVSQKLFPLNRFIPLISLCFSSLRDLGPVYMTVGDPR